MTEVPHAHRRWGPYWWQWFGLVFGLLVGIANGPSIANIVTNIVIWTLAALILDTLYRGARALFGHAKL